MIEKNLPVRIGPRPKLKIMAQPMAAVAVDVFSAIAFVIAKIWSVKKSIKGKMNGIKINTRLSSWNKIYFFYSVKSYWLTTVLMGIQQCSQTIFYIHDQTVQFENYLFFFIKNEFTKPTPESNKYTYKTREENSVIVQICKRLLRPLRFPFITNNIEIIIFCILYHFAYWLGRK